MEIRFDGKIVLVTGASRGIGKAVASQFALAGATVAVHYNSNHKAAKSLLIALPGQGHACLPADLGKPGDIEKLAAAALKQFGKIDILVNNAGIFEEKDMASMSFRAFKEYWDRTIGVNLSGPAFISHLISRQMIKQGGGKIVNISSRGAFRGEPDAWAYGASKAGLNSLGQSMAKALAPHGISVYTLAPGFVETDMTKPCLKGKRRAEILSQSPMNRMAGPDEIARAVLMLCAEGNEYMTGCIVDMNGASYLRS
ncbi:MAG: SDR family NAD(P)-dependent oxidoreductase [Bacteroidetes bacterium]|nr:SDR family NAD(P)-dependent oxidoreductase [Bacteroidota bacterium]